MINRAPSGAFGALSGDPVFGPWGAILDPNAHIDFPVADTPQITAIVVARKRHVIGGGMTLLSS